MPPLTSDKTNTRVRGREKAQLPIVPGVTAFAGGLQALIAPTHPTAALRGRIRPWTGSDHEAPIGVLVEGNSFTDPSSVVPPTDGIVDTSGRRMLISIAGVSSQAQAGALVYAMDDATYTLTPPTKRMPIGMVLRHETGTMAEVLFFTPIEALLASMAGFGRETVLLGVISGAFSASGDGATDIAAPNHARILRTFGIVTSPLTGAGASLSIQLRIGATLVTGGVISWTVAAGVGAKLAGTPVTADNEYHEGDLIDIAVTVTTAGTGGLLAVYAEVERLPGI